MKKLVLFDIDGTLVRGYSSHIKATEKAISSVLGKKIKIGVKEVQGKPCQKIFIEQLAKHGRDLDFYEKFKEEIMQSEINEFPEATRDSKIILLPGVTELLEELKRKGIKMGLLTGNLENIAWRKLERQGIEKYFKFGGFGDDGVERKEIIRNLLDKNNIAEEKILIIGDALEDIKGAKDNNIQIMAVATGHFSESELKKHNPDYLFKDLSDTEEVMKTIL